VFESNDRVRPSGRARPTANRGIRGGAAVLIAALVAILLLAGCGGDDDTPATGGQTGASNSKAAPIRIAFSTWNGYIGIVIGVKEGLFEKAGVKVGYTVVEDPVQRFNALKAGSLDAIATTSSRST
jgi:ABC-type nitrate/sulfonate/bicarbonate transport system substrate-binding protein